MGLIKERENNNNKSKNIAKVKKLMFYRIRYKLQRNWEKSDKLRILIENLSFKVTDFYEKNRYNIKEI